MRRALTAVILATAMLLGQGHASAAPTPHSWEHWKATHALHLPAVPAGDDLTPAMRTAIGRFQAARARQTGARWVAFVHQRGIWRAKAAKVAAAATPTTYTPSTVPATGSVPDLIRATFGSASSTALCIAWRESRYDPGAKNGSSSASGVFQLVSGWWTGSYGAGWGYPLGTSWNPFDASLNIQAAHVMYLHEGWSPWGGGC